MLQSTVRVLGNGLVHVFVAAQFLVDAVLLGNDLARTGGIQLIGGLGIQPGHGAAQAQTLGGNDTYVAGGEGLAHDAGVVYGHGLVSHGLQTVVTLVEHGVGGSAQLLVLLGVHNDGDLALVHNGLELALDLGVQHLADVTELEARLKVGLADTDTDHVTLTGVHNALDAVQIGVELPLHNGLEVGLHGLTGHVHGVGHGDLGAHGDLVDFRSDDGDLVVLDLGGFLGVHQLEAVHTGAVNLHLHIGTADDLALESGSEGNRDIDIGDLDLDVPGLQRGGVELLNIGLHDQALGNTEDVLLLVGDDGEAQSNGAGAAGNDHIVQRSEGVDESGHTLHGVLHQTGSVTGLDVAEDQSGTDGHGDNMDDGGDILAQGDDADVVAGLVLLLLELIDDAAHQSDQHALALIALDQSNGLVSGRSGAQDNGNTGDVAGNQGNTQRTDNGIGQMAVAGSLVGSVIADVLQNLDEFCAQSGGNAGHEGIVQAVVAGHQALDNAQGFLQLTQGLDLDASDAVVAGQGICGAGEGHGLALTVLCDGIVDSCLGQAVDSVVAAENSFK